MHTDFSRPSDCSVLAPHPHDGGVQFGRVGVLEDVPAEVDAVVSLCCAEDEQVTSPFLREDRVEVWLVDHVGEHENPYLDYVLKQAPYSVVELHAKGQTVLPEGDPIVACKEALTRSSSS